MLKEMLSSTLADTLNLKQALGNPYVSFEVPRDEVLASLMDFTNKMDEWVTYMPIKDLASLLLTNEKGVVPRDFELTYGHLFVYSGVNKYVSVVENLLKDYARHVGGEFSTAKLVNHEVWDKLPLELQGWMGNAKTNFTKYLFFLGVNDLICKSRVLPILTSEEVSNMYTVTWKLESCEFYVTTEIKYPNRVHTSTDKSRGELGFNETNFSLFHKYFGRINTPNVAEFEDGYGLGASKKLVGVAIGKASHPKLVSDFAQSLSVKEKKYTLKDLQGYLALFSQPYLSLDFLNELPKEEVKNLLSKNFSHGDENWETLRDVLIDLTTKHEFTLTDSEPMSYSMEREFEETFETMCKNNSFFSFKSDLKAELSVVRELMTREVTKNYSLEETLTMVAYYQMVINVIRSLADSLVHSFEVVGFVGETLVISLGYDSEWSDSKLPALKEGFMEAFKADEAYLAYKEEHPVHVDWLTSEGSLICF